MKSELEVSEYEIKLSSRRFDCKDCKGNDLKCRCRIEIAWDVEKFEACIPMDHWKATERVITHNESVFNELILKYCAKLKTAYRNGYGMILVGEPGSGKTTFLSYILVCSIEKGYYPYYTTFARLDHHLKMGFHDTAAARRLEEMLGRSFVVIDDMGKENFKGGDSYFRAQFERILRERYENRMPTLLATNALTDEWKVLYGDSVASLLSGRFIRAIMEPGDMRRSPELIEKMEREMGFRGAL